MADQLTPAQRSALMSRVKGSNTKPEVAVRRFLHAHGLRFRLHVRDLPGTPDIVLPRRNTVVFVNGCFWHCHPGCKRAALPSSRPEFWRKKLTANKERDLRVRRELKQMGWHVETVWTCELKHTERLVRLAVRLKQR